MNEDLTSSSDSSDYENWIQWFCGQKGCEFFCEIDEEFVESNFNLYGLRNKVKHYNFCLDVILDTENPELESVGPELLKEIQENAEKLYGLIHTRFILTREGQNLMKKKYNEADFGRCPRVSCGAKVLPVGLTDVIGKQTVKVYCPVCNDTYHKRPSKNKKIDGAYFGTTFPHLFLMRFKDKLKTIQKKKKKKKVDFVPKIFGFKVVEV